MGWLGGICVRFEVVFVCVCGFKTHPCVDSKRLRVCRQNALVLCDTGVLLAPHGGVFNLHTEVSNVPHHTHKTHTNTPTHHTNTHQQDTDNTPTPKPAVILRVFLSKSINVRAKAGEPCLIRAYFRGGHVAILTCKSFVKSGYRAVACFVQDS